MSNKKELIDLSEYDKIYFLDDNGEPCFGFVDDDLIAYFPINRDYDSWRDITIDIIGRKIPVNPPSNEDEFKTGLDSLYDSVIKMFMVKNSMDFFIDKDFLKIDDPSVRSLKNLINKAYHETIYTIRIWKENNKEFISKNPDIMQRIVNTKFLELLPNEKSKYNNLLSIFHGNENLDLVDASISVVGKENLKINNKIYHNKGLTNILNDDELKAKPRIIN